GAVGTDRKRCVSPGGTIERWQRSPGIASSFTVCGLGGIIHDHVWQTRGCATDSLGPVCQRLFLAKAAATTVGAISAARI
ncbi:MAG TPA: hypothetical protein PL064_10915, partial [Thermogutta sp.]|nr:hypothetical protein [Thermogutta sp.]